MTRKKKVATTQWDAAEHLNTADEIAGYLKAIMEEGDPALLSAALGNIARSKGMAEIARRSGMGRESLYKALSPGGNPKLSTLFKVFEALGLQLRAEPVKKLPAVAPRSTAVRARTATR